MLLHSVLIGFHFRVYAGRCTLVHSAA